MEKLQKYSDYKIAKTVYDNICPIQYKKENQKEYEIYFSVEEYLLRNIIGFKKRLSKKMGIVVDYSNLKEFSSVCEVYFYDKIKMRINSKKGEEVTFKDLFDEITKEKVKIDNLSEDYIDILEGFSKYICKKIKISDPRRLIKEIIGLQTRIEINKKALNEITEKILSRYDDTRVGTVSNYIQSGVDFICHKECIHIVPLGAESLFKDIPEKNITDRIVIYLFMENKKRQLKKEIENIKNENDYCKDTKKRYTIPEKKIFTLEDIAEIYSASKKEGDCDFINKVYLRLRKIVLKVPLLNSYKEDATRKYKIPYEETLNFLYELEIREENNKQKNYKMMTIEDMGSLYKKKQTKYNHMLCARRALAFSARENNQGEIYNLTREFQIKYYSAVINSLSIENIFLKNSHA